mmetsp:Transcript_36329/g.35943  ORF Transcript_36329/g.35943 Transcript_36329/m.35943 type:complete len:241 (-) Transcript_36329:151-873(-)
MIQKSMSLFFSRSNIVCASYSGWDLRDVLVEGLIRSRRNADCQHICWFKITHVFIPLSHYALLVFIILSTSLWGRLILWDSTWRRSTSCILLRLSSLAVWRSSSFILRRSTSITTLGISSIISLRIPSLSSSWRLGIFLGSRRLGILLLRTLWLLLVLLSSCWRISILLSIIVGNSSRWRRYFTSCWRWNIPSRRRGISHWRRVITSTSLLLLIILLLLLLLLISIISWRSLLSLISTSI